MRELGREIWAVNSPYKPGKRFLVSQVRNQLFVELLPQKQQLNKQERLPVPNSQTESQLPDLFSDLPIPKSKTANSGSLSSTPDPLLTLEDEPSLSELSIPENTPIATPSTTFVLSASNTLTSASELSSPSISKSDEEKRKELQKTKRRKRMNSKPSKIDILIITALPKELNALLRCEDPSDSSSEKWKIAQDSLNLTYYWRHFEKNNGTSFSVAAASALRIGEQAATTRAATLALQLRPKCLAMVGICAGNREDGNICTKSRGDEEHEENVHLGDVIVADRVFDLEFGKQKVYYNDKSQSPQEYTYHNLTTYNLPAIWRDRINHLSQQPIEWINSIASKRPKSDEHQEHWLLHQGYKHQCSPQTCENPQSHPEKDKECPNWSKITARLWEEKLLANGTLEPTDAGRRLVEKDLVQNRAERDPLEPRVHLGSIGTSKKVIRDPKVFDNLQKIQCTVLGVEMEGNAIGAVAEDLGVPMIVVKGVADYADHSKNNQFHEYAAEASASFLIAFLREHWPPK